MIDNADGRNNGDTLAHPGQAVDYDGWVGIIHDGKKTMVW